MAADLLQPPRSVLLAAAALFGLLAHWFGQFALVGSGVWLGVVLAFWLYGAIGMWLIGAQLRHYVLLLSGFQLTGVVVKATLAVVLGRRIGAWTPTSRTSPKAP